MIQSSFNWPTPMLSPWEVDNPLDLIERVKSDILFADRFFLPRSPELFSFQNASLKAYSEYMFVWEQAYRGTSKSYKTGRYALVEGLRNKAKFVFTAPTYRQALHPWNYVKSILLENCDESLPMNLDREIVRILENNNNASKIVLANGSEFVALPMGNGEKIRGERADVLFIDEFFAMEKLLYQNHVLPFLQGHRPEGRIGPKLILTTSAEYQDCFAYTVLTQRWLKKILQEDAMIVADPGYRRKYVVLDITVADVKASGYRVDDDILEQQLAGAPEEERLQALENKWIGISGQFFPGNLLDRMSSKDVSIEHESEPGYSYALSVDVATQQHGDFFVVDVWKFLKETKQMAFVNSFWTKGLTADEMAWKIHDFNRRFHPEWIVMDKGGGGLFVAQSLGKPILVMKDGVRHEIALPILEHNETGNINGERKLILTRPTDEMVRAGFADDRSRGGEHIHAEDILVHLLHDGLRQALRHDVCPILVPAEYTDGGYEEESNAAIFEHIRESILQLRHLTLKITENADGTKEVAKTKVSKVPSYVWKNSVKDGASAFIYGYIAYRVFYRFLRETKFADPIVIPTFQSRDWSGMVEYSENQQLRQGV